MQGFKDYKDRCSDCFALMEVRKKWFCDEFGQNCEDIKECPFWKATFWRD